MNLMMFYLLLPNIIIILFIYYNLKTDERSRGEGVKYTVPNIYMYIKERVS